LLIKGGVAMKLITLLPADRYVVVNKSILTDKERKNLISLYEPIIGYAAVSLYLTLWRDLDRLELVSMDYTHHHLMTLLKCDLEVIKKSRESLESVGLIKTYIKEGDTNSYVYELYSPLSPKEFFSHPIFSVVLYNNLGKYEYDLLKSEFQVYKIDLKDYQDISCKLNDTYKSSSNVVFDAIGTKELTLTQSDQVDFDLLLSSIPKGILNERSFTKKTKELINNLAFIYNLDTLKMSELIRLVINEKGFIDKEELRKNARKYYQYNNNGKLPTLVYRTQPEYLKNPTGDNSNRGKIIGVFENTSPYDFLKSKYNGSNPTSRDLKLLETLLIDLNLKPAVVNVLIDYVLKKNNNKLNTAFVEAIAGQWKRLNIETAEDAMNVAEKDHKKYNKKIATPKMSTATEPVWFNETLEKENMTEEEQNELESILNKYR
jgi:replication initiation and membrane attachment protein